MSKSKRSGKNKVVGNAGSGKPLKDTKALIQEVEKAIDDFSYDKAERKCSKILKLDPNNVQVHEMLAGVHLEQSKWKEAERTLQRCIQLSPDVGHMKYFSLAQLYEGQKSLEFYRKGICILQKELEELQPSEESKKKSLQRSLSDAYCAVAEIFMTDCCGAENAEQQCSEAAEHAVKCDPSNPGAYQCLATFHIEKGQDEEAKTALEKSVSLWLPHYESLRDNESLSTVAQDVSQPVIPEYDHRIQTGKLLIELNMYDEATNVLEALLTEDDDVTEVWYLLGWLHYLQGDDHGELALVYLERAKQLQMKEGTDEFNVDELIDDLKQKLPEHTEGGCNNYEPQSSESDEENQMETG